MSKNILLLFFVLILSSCSMKWHKAIQKGSTLKKEFSEELSFDTKLKLIILPVEIEGKIYRFLFDTGAPFSISNELQEKLQYKVISKGNIVDTDKNKIAVNYVSVDSLFLGNVPFYKQTAFVGDFRANPIIACMELDGIIGSNLIRHCNWYIKEEENIIQISNKELPAEMKEAIVIPFKVDMQYNMKLDIVVGNVNAKNVTIDYGSNGAFSLRNESFKQLNKSMYLKETFKEEGFTSSGLIGKPASFTRELAYLDTLNVEGNVFLDVLVKSGNSNLLGRSLLCRYNTFIDWENQQLYLKRNDKKASTYEVFGLQAGLGKNNSVVVQSVIEQSTAAKAGIKPQMQILKVNDLDFTKNNDYCDYIRLMDSLPRELFLELKDEDGDILQIKLQKRRLGEI